MADFFAAAAGQPVPLSTFSPAGLRVDADTIPTVLNTMLNGVQTTFPASVSQVTDSGGNPIPGAYTVSVDATGMSGGDQFEVLVQATIDGTVRTLRVQGTILGSTPVVTAIDPLIACNDDFQDNAIDPSWSVVNQGATIVETGGQLVFNPADSSGVGQAWYGSNRGPLVSKPITGDFRATTTVRLSNDLGTGLPPLASLRFLVGGIIVEDPNPAAVGSFHGAIAMFNNSYSAEVKSTDDDFSTIWANNAVDQGGIANGIDSPAYEITPPGGTTELVATVRVCRVGQVFTAHISYDGGLTWPISQSVDRATTVPYDSGSPAPGSPGGPTPMPSTVNVGLMAYNSFANPADFQARFDDISFETLGGGFAPSCI